MKAVKIFSFGFRGFPHTQGGIETHVENLYPLLVEAGLEVHCAIRHSYKNSFNSSDWKGVKFHPIKSPKIKGAETLIHSFLSVIYAIKLRPDIIHIHAIGPSITLPLVRLLGFKVIVTHHGPEYRSKKWGPLGRLILKTGEYLGMRLSHERIVVSQELQEIVKSNHNRSATIIPNGITLPIVSPANKISEKYPLNTGKYILLVSRLVPEKRHSDLIEAFVLAAVPEWKLVIVGASDHNDDYSKQIVSSASGNSDIIFTGFQSGGNLNELYSNAGFFVLPSSIEGMPIAMLEALSYGLPVIASDIPANKEVGLPTENYYSVGNVAELEIKLRLFCSKEVTPEVKELNRRWVHERYNWSDVAKKTLAVYASLSTSASSPENP